MIRQNAQGVLHYLEFNVREKRPAFRSDLCARLALQVLGECCNTHPAKLPAYVVMPTHLHCVLNPRDGDAVRFTRDFKAALTLAYDRLAEAQGWTAARAWLCATADGHRQLWQDGKYDFFLWSERLIWQKIDYIHHNPVRAKLVNRASEYPYSSFRAWYDVPGEVILPIDRDFWWEDLTPDEIHDWPEHYHQRRGGKPNL